MENPAASSDKANLIFSLTLDEFQTKSGKSFGSMNIDEILNFLNEGNSDCVNLDQMKTRKYQNAPIHPAKLAPQESFSIPTTLGGKTVEEILFNIDKDQAENPSLKLNIGTYDPTFYQESLDNMTLEDFLVKIGIVKKSPEFFPQKSVFENFQNPCLDMGYHGQFSNDPSNYGANNLLGESSSLYKMFNQGGGVNILSQPCNNNSSNNGNENGGKGSENGSGNGSGNNGATDVSDPRNKRRATNDRSEEISDMKQRRMIKNRESAARSRVKKQAYKMEVESQLKKLKEENAELKYHLKDLNERLAIAHRMQNKARTLTRTSSF